MCCVLLNVLQMNGHYVRFEVFMAVAVKNVVFWDVTTCGSCKSRHFGEELRASIIRVTRMGEVGTLAVTSNRRTLRRNAKFVRVHS
jgi:hypothetical protein